MNTLGVIIIATLAVSAVSFAGILILGFKERILNKILLFLVTLSAGALLGGAMLHLLPEAIAKTDLSESAILNVFLALLVGFISFFVLEQFLGWHHCHKHGGKEKCQKAHLPGLILTSDGIHNFVDGMVLAASFLVSIPVGIAATLAVVLHEIPQEIGDFGVLIYGGVKKSKALLFNFLSALTAVLGGVVGYFAFVNIETYLPYILAFMAGHFIYIASSDLIPEIKEEYKKGLGRSFAHFIVFIVGLALMLVLKIVSE